MLRCREIGFADGLQFELEPKVVHHSTWLPDV